jgi:hypothetical protein
MRGTSKMNDRPDRFRNGPGPDPVQPGWGPEPLGEGYDDQDRQLDASLTAAAREIPIIEGLNDRLFAASIHDLRQAQDTLAFPGPDTRARRPVALQLMAMAACLAIAVTAAWLLVQTGQRTGSPGTADLARVDVQPDVVTEVLVQPNLSPVVAFGDPAPVEADIALLASNRDQARYSELSALVATRDMRFDDLSSEFGTVLEAMHDPSLMVYDVELRP